MRPADVSPRRRFLVITPCRNEAEHLPTMLRTVVEQTLPPTRWVIVDDGSTDATPEIAAAAAERHPFVRVVRRSNRGRRSVGPGVIEAFDAGLRTVDLADYDYVCKLDGDLELPPRYFEAVIEAMERDPWLGNYSGKVYNREADGSLSLERMGDENAIGAAKFYRVACFEDIGGFVPHIGWDGVDGHACRLKGWIARSKDDAELRMVHRRLLGSSDQNTWVGRRRWGTGKYYMGSAWYYVVGAAIYRMFQHPPIVGGIGILWGYLTAMFAGAGRHGDREFRRFVRRFELRCLLFGKNRTLHRYDERIHRARNASPRP